MTNNNQVTCAQFFDSFVKKLQPSKQDRNYASEKHIWLRETLSLDKQVQRTFLSGSYSRSTAIAPLHDVDIFVVLDEKSLYGPFVNHLIEILKRILVGSRWKETDKDTFLVSLEDNQKLIVRKQKSSVGVSWGNYWGKEGVTFDLVPAVENSHGSFTIYKRRSGPIHTNPEKAQEEVKKYNAKWNGHFCNFVKLVKKWNKENEKINEKENMKNLSRAFIWKFYAITLLQNMK